MTRVTMLKVAPNIWQTRTVQDNHQVALEEITLYIINL